MKIIDISMPISKDMVVYLGNPTPFFEKYAKIPENNTNETKITIGSHTGTHVDAPLHVHAKGISAKDLPLTSYYGSCIVLDLTKTGNTITKSHLERYKIRKNEVVLLKTENSLKQYNTFRKNFAHIDMSAANWLVDKKVKTLGIDYLSIKKYNQDDDVHIRIIDNMVLFEGLYLKNVKPGRYTFIGLPLKLDLDGSPARAILLQR